MGFVDRVLRRVGTCCLMGVICGDCPCSVHYRLFRYDYVTFFLSFSLTSANLREETLPSVGMCGGVTRILRCVAVSGASWSVRCVCRCGCGGCGREGL